MTVSRIFSMMISTLQMRPFLKKQNQRKIARGADCYI